MPTKSPFFKKINLKRLIRAFVVTWFFIGGICHFLLPELFVLIVPSYVPFKLLAVYISGFFELIGALGLLMPLTRLNAGYGLIVLTILVTPANIYMLQNAALFPSVSVWALIVRLPFQLVLIWLIWWSARDNRFV